MWLPSVACALQSRCSSCFIMCCHMSPHSSGNRPQLVRYCTWVAQLRAQTRTHTQSHVRSCARSPARAPFAGSCRNHMFYKNPREGVERRMTSADISISVIKDTTVLKVSLCAVYKSEIKSPDLSQKLHQTILNTEIMLICLYRGAPFCSEQFTEFQKKLRTCGNMALSLSL